MFRLFVLLALAALARAAEPPPLVTPEHRVTPDDPAWHDVLTRFAERPATGISDFEEHRWFTFKKTPTVVQGVARVSKERGLSLAYAGPPPRVVIIDDRGLLVRENGRDSAPPADALANATNGALLHLLRFDLPALTGDFDIYGEHTETGWTLALVPRADALRRTLGQITVAGEGAIVRRIELRRSSTQRVEILIQPPRALGEPFGADDVRRFFR